MSRDLLAASSIAIAPLYKPAYRWRRLCMVCYFCPQEDIQERLQVMSISMVFVPQDTNGHEWSGASNFKPCLEWV
jgi:hypothetical protein